MLTDKQLAAILTVALMWRWSHSVESAYALATKIVDGREIRV